MPFIVRVYSSQFLRQFLLLEFIGLRDYVTEIASKWVFLVNFCCVHVVNLCNSLLLHANFKFQQRCGTLKDGNLLNW